MTYSPFIRLKGVDLYYSSLAYYDNSLKGFVLNLLTHRNQRYIRDIHALKNLSFDLSPGERVALLGHNGAGKSTLLKAIAGLYPISNGKLDTHGDIRALFDISLGFEPDATGRENILYRGLLLGQSPKQMRNMESEIVEFADIGELIDYPVKTYSAGMQVRLAFAISTAIPGDILLLDEVIGAGDAAFMVKAQKRIVQLIEQANIMVLASHDFSAVRNLCKRALVLDHGNLMFDGNVEEGIQIAQRLQGIKTIQGVGKTG
jgi:lipopolysaccharide transport system ATP-binding protein